MNMLLDFISLKGSGPLREFWNVCRSLEVERAWQALGALSDLGHMDAHPLPSESWWSCGAPTLAMLSDPSRYTVVGARSPDLADELRKLGELTVEKDSRGPDLWFAKFADKQEAKAAADKLGLAFAEEPAGWRFLKALPSLDDYLALPQISRRRPQPPSDEPPMQWDPTNGAWMNATFLGQRGLWLFRDRFTGRRVPILSNGQELREVGDLGAARTLMFRESGGRLKRDEKTQTVTVSRGCSLPRPYARALTLCSGRIATDAGGNTTYRAIPMRVANLLSARMGVAPQAEVTP